MSTKPAPETAATAEGAGEGEHQEHVGTEMEMSRMFDAGAAETVRGGEEHDGDAAPGGEHAAETGGEQHVHGWRWWTRADRWVVDPAEETGPGGPGRSRRLDGGSWVVRKSSARR